MYAKCAKSKTDEDKQTSYKNADTTWMTCCLTTFTGSHNSWQMVATM